MTELELEMEARRYRDILYGPCGEHNWNQCKGDWIKDIEWLRSMARKAMGA